MLRSILVVALAAATVGCGQSDNAMPGPGPDEDAMGGDKPDLARMVDLWRPKDIQFAEPQQYKTGGGLAFGIVAADFNGDGTLDLATADIGMSRGISMMRGGPGATFRPEARYAQTENPFAIVAGDFNGDKQLDIAVTDHPGSNLAVLMGTGPFQFAAPADTGSSGDHDALVSGDWNRDGKIDLATTDAGSTVSIFLGDGKGGFALGSAPDSGTAPMGIATGDWNGDGQTDLAIADQDAMGVTLRFGAKDGTFASSKTIPIGANLFWVAGGDFNGDGKLDLAAVSDVTGALFVLIAQNGDGTFLAPVRYKAGHTPVYVVAADFNGDGRPDLAVAEYFMGSGGVGIFAGDGDGTFQKGVFITLPPTMVPVPRARALAVADFNGDGKPDLAVADTEGKAVWVLLNATN